MPSAMSIMLPRNHIDSISEAQPDIALPPKCDISTHADITTSSSSSTRPRPNMRRIGLAVNDVMPSTDSEQLAERVFCFSGGACAAVVGHGCPFKADGGHYAAYEEVALGVFFEDVEGAASHEAKFGVVVYRFESEGALELVECPCRCPLVEGVGAAGRLSRRTLCHSPGGRGAPFRPRPAGESPEGRRRWLSRRRPWGAPSSGRRAWRSAGTVMGEGYAFEAVVWRGGGL